MTYNEIDPISLEPFTDSSRRIVFNYGGGSVHYDFDVFYKNIHQMKSVPHSRQPFTESFKLKFNELCREFGEKEAFKLTPVSQPEHPDVIIILFLTVIISIFLIAWLYMLTTNYY